MAHSPKVGPDEPTSQHSPTSPSPLTRTLAGGRAVVVTSVLIVTPIMRAKTALAGDRPGGRGSTSARANRWNERCGPMPNIRSPARTSATSCPTAVTAKTAAYPGLIGKLALRYRASSVPELISEATVRPATSCGARGAVSAAMGRSVACSFSVNVTAWAVPGVMRALSLPPAPPRARTQQPVHSPPAPACAQAAAACRHPVQPTPAASRENRDCPLRGELHPDGA